jgi:hypothetical protein
MQITMIGLFGLKSKPSASIATIPLLLLTIMFNEYCKIRFLPTFRHYSVKVCICSLNVSHIIILAVYCSCLKSDLAFLFTSVKKSV